jgi:hypothetical protein
MKQYYKNYIIGIGIIGIIGIICIVFVILKNLMKYKLGFQNYNTVKWSDDLITRFTRFQDAMNIEYNMEELQRQVSPEEAEEFLKYGSWEWPEELKDLYMQKISSSPIVKIDPHFALESAMKIYNKNAATELLAWNSKEGEFMIHGGFGKTKNLIKCSDNVNSMVKIVGPQIEIEIKPEDIPKEMPGFSFVSNKCNPCDIFHSDNESGCAFKLNVQGDDTISYPWKKIWKLL